MPTRRDFLRQSTLLTSAASVLAGSQSAIARALAIEPIAGSSFLDAEHVVILMQENRSFDHMFGTLSGVRGFNDPRAIRLPDGNPVWVQATSAGDRYVPFRLDLHSSKSTWMGCLPHNWTDQVDARNNGRFDRWLDVKQSGHGAYAKMPLTLGYYTRADLPFYYALADAFTVCDQHFCSTLTGTTPNRLHLWTGTIRARQSADAKANVLNSDVDHGAWANWTTFPERLEDHGISWKVYQNELTIESGLTSAEDQWLANFGDNPLEYFAQYHVRHARPHREFVKARAAKIPGEIQKLREQLPRRTAEQAAKDGKRIIELTSKLKQYEQELREFTDDSFQQLPPKLKNIHARAFDTNIGDPNYRQLARLTYRDGNQERTMQVPKGDVLFQFRQDVANGKLPTVSWIAGSEKFSDHPTSPWYGAWYISEILNILTNNPKVWQKTIFILTYDENDGYFDHVPPFVAPHPRRPETGRVTAGIDASLEYVELEQDMKHKPRHQARESAIGLGYRVPMLIASPWSRGGCVCSQVFDHTSSLQFLEKFLSHKTGKEIKEPNVNQWRRTVCGDLTSAFQAPDAVVPPLPFHDRDSFLQGIHNAQHQPIPAGFHALNAQEIAKIRQNPRASSILPKQEPGRRRSAPLPYHLMANCRHDRNNQRLLLDLRAGTEHFGKQSAGGAFIVYAVQSNGDFTVRNYAVEPGAIIEDSWDTTKFADGLYHLIVAGPNGFLREYRGFHDEPAVSATVGLDSPRPEFKFPSYNLCLNIIVREKEDRLIHIVDRSHGAATRKPIVPTGRPYDIVIDTRSSYGWYDFSLVIPNVTGFEMRFAGRVETGAWSFSDPALERRT